MPTDTELQVFTTGNANISAFTAATQHANAQGNAAQVAAGNATAAVAGLDANVTSKVMTAVAPALAQVGSATANAMNAQATLGDYVSGSIAFPRNPTTPELTTYPGVVRGSRLLASGAVQPIAWDRSAVVWRDVGSPGATKLDTDAALGLGTALQTSLQLPRPALGGQLAYSGDLETVVVGQEPWTRAASSAVVDGVTVIADTLGRKWARKILPRLDFATDFQAKPGRDETVAWQAAMDYIRAAGGGTLMLGALFSVFGTGPNCPSFLTLETPGWGARKGIGGAYAASFGLDGGGNAGQFLTWDTSGNVENVRLLGVTFANRQRYLAGPSTVYLSRWRMEESSLHRSCEVGISGNPYYARIINNLLGYEGASGSVFQALNFEGTSVLPANKISLQGNHIYGGAGSAAVVNVSKARRLSIDHDNFEQNRSAAILSLTDVQHADIDGAWFELNGAAFQIELHGNTDHIHLRGLEWASHRTNTAFLVNATGRDIDLTWEDIDPVLLGRYLGAGGTVVGEPRLTADHIGYDRAFGTYVAPLPTQNDIDTTVAGYDPYGQNYQGSVASRPYPYVPTLNSGDGIIRKGVANTGPLTLPVAPTLTGVFGAPALTAGATSTVLGTPEQVILRSEYTLTPAAVGDLSYQITSIPAGWQVLRVDVSYGSFSDNGHPEAAAHRDLVHLNNTNTLPHQLRVDFVLIPA
jgi:hypothetical protein